jgi:hypothetical protein
MASTALMAFAITVTMFSGDADTLRITHHRVLTLADCAKWQALFKKEKTRAADPTTGRLILSVRYECVPIIPQEFEQKLGRAGEPFP